MKKFAISMMLLAGSAFAGEWTGYISESKCKAAHADGSQKSIDCVKGCIKGGAKPVLVVDGKVVNIANPDKITEAMYGMKVTVSGDLKDDALTVATAKLAK